jgi:hypothetical protein
MLTAMEPRIELLWWDGCPSTERTLADLRSALREAGLDPKAIELREVASDEQAERERFPGSPTIRINGRDPFPGEVSIGLSCRIYRSAEGRPSPTPDPAELRAAIAREVAA